MDMRIFQVTSNQTAPLHEGSILIASPLLNDYHFVRSVILNDFTRYGREFRDSS